MLNDPNKYLEGKFEELLTEAKKVDKWVQKAEKKGEVEHGAFPKGFFAEKKTAEGYVAGLLKYSDGDVGKAIKRVTFFLNRNSEAPNKTALESAKKKLEKKLEKTKKESVEVSETVMTESQEIVKVNLESYRYQSLSDRFLMDD